MVRPVKKAVFPVAGLGTRFLPATKAMPKEMLPVVDRPLIQYAVDEALAAGIEDLILVTGRGKNIMEDHFDHAYELEHVLAERGKTAELTIVRDFPDPGCLSYTRQQQPLGLGHYQVVRQQHREGFVAQGLAGAPHRVAEDDGKLARAQGLVEKPDPAEAPSTLSIIGRYILQPEVFAHLDKQERGAGNEIQLTDAMAATLGEVPFYGYRFDGRRFDCGTKLGFIAANVAFAAARGDLGGDIRDVLADVL